MMAAAKFLVRIVVCLCGILSLILIVAIRMEKYELPPDIADVAAPVLVATAALGVFVAYSGWGEPKRAKKQRRSDVNDIGY